MTHERFWELYDNGEIKVKVFAYDNLEAPDGCMTHGEIDAFEFGGKFYLRFYKEYAPAGYRKHYKNGGSSSSTIKEFDNKNSANNYFKMAANGFKRVQ